MLLSLSLKLSYQKTHLPYGKAVKSSKTVESAIGTKDTWPEIVYLEALAEAYQNAASFETRRQILSVMADLVPYKTIQEYIPGINLYRIKTARHHVLQHGRGAVIDSK